MMLKGVGGVLVVLAVVLIVAGVPPLLRERGKYANFSSAHVKVTTRLVSLPKGGDSREFEYQFSDDGKPMKYTTDKAPVNLSVPDISRLVPGQAEEQEADGYYDKFNKKVIFPETYSFLYYWRILGAMPLLGIGMGLLLVRDPMLDRRCDIPAPRVGMFELKPLYPANYRRMVACLLAVLWNLICIPVTLDYFLHGSNDNRAGGVMLAGAFLLAGLAALGVAVHYFRVDGRIKSTRVLVDVLPMSVGKSVQMQCVQEFARKCKLAEVRIGLICQVIQAPARTGSIWNSLRTKAVPHTQQWKDVLINRAVTKGQHITINHVFEIPMEAVPASPMSQKTYPVYAWQVQLHLTFVDGPDYWVKFPVLVDLYIVQSTVKKLG